MLRWSPLLFALIGLLLHLASGEAVYAGAQPDYAAHLAFVRDLAARGPFPLPYSGMIGAHSVAALAHLLLGLELPRAMLLVADLSLLGVAAAIGLALPAGRNVKAALVAPVVAFFAVSLPLYAHCQRFGFFAHWASMGPYALAVALRLRGPISRNPRSWAPLGLTLFGAWCYPDAAMWLLPWMWWPLAALSVVIAVRQAGLLDLRGAALSDWTPQVVALVGALAAFTTQQTRRAMGLPVLAWMSLTLAFLLGGYVVHGHVGYYARKNLYPLAVMAPLLATQLPPRVLALRFGALAAIAALMLGFVRNPWLQLADAGAVWRAPRSVFSIDDVRRARGVKARATAMGCSGVVVFPALTSTKEWERVTVLSLWNAYGGAYVGEGGALRWLEPSAAISVTQRLDSGAAPRALVAEPVADGLCLALPGPDGVPAPQRLSAPAF